MAKAQFPQTPDLEVPASQRIGDGTNITFGKYTVSNPHPGFGKDPNILNEFGHTMYPKILKYVDGQPIIAENAEHEAELNNEASVPEVKAPAGWGK